MTLATATFETLLQSLIKARGLPSLPYLVFPRDFDHFPEEEIRRNAAERLHEVADALTNARTKDRG